MIFMTIDCFIFLGIFSNNQNSETFFLTTIEIAFKQNRTGSSALLSLYKSNNIKENLNNMKIYRKNTKKRFRIKAEFCKQIQTEKVRINFKYLYCKIFKYKGQQ